MSSCQDSTPTPGQPNVSPGSHKPFPKPPRDEPSPEGWEQLRPFRAVFLSRVDDPEIQEALATVGGWLYRLAMEDFRWVQAKEGVNVFTLRALIEDLEHSAAELAIIGHDRFESKISDEEHAVCRKADEIAGTMRTLTGELLEMIGPPPE